MNTDTTYKNPLLDFPIVNMIKYLVKKTKSINVSVEYSPGCNTV